MDTGVVTGIFNQMKETTEEKCAAEYVDEGIIKERCKRGDEREESTDYPDICCQENRYAQAAYG